MIAWHHLFHSSCVHALHFVATNLLWRVVACTVLFALSESEFSCSSTFLKAAIRISADKWLATHAIVDSINIWDQTRNAFKSSSSTCTSDLLVSAYHDKTQHLGGIGITWRYSDFASLPAWFLKTIALSAQISQSRHNCLIGDYRIGAVIFTGWRNSENTSKNDSSEQLYCFCQWIASCWNMAQVLHTENTNRTTNTVEPSLNTQQIVLTDDVIPNDSDALQSGLQAQLDSSFPQDFEGKKDLILSRRDATCGGVSDQGVLKGDEGNVGLLGSGDGSGTEFGKECGPDVGRECGVKKSGGRPKSFVWQYYSQVSDANNKSKRCRVLCQACGEEFVSRVEQMEAHLAHHCSKTDPEVAEIMKARIAAAKAAAKLKKESGLRQAALSASATTIRAAMPINAPLPKRQKIEVASPSSQNVIPLHLRYPQASQTSVILLLTSNLTFISISMSISILYSTLITVLISNLVIILAAIKRGSGTFTCWEIY